MTESIQQQRLTQERKSWRKDHPYGFFAKPEKNPDSINLTKWSCAIPGKEGTEWEGGLYKLQLSFPPAYPIEPPHCQFIPPIFHPNIYDDGEVCLSIIDQSKDWKPAISIKQILMGIQDMLTEPNPNSPAQTDAFVLFVHDRAKYDERIRQQSVQFKNLE